MLHRGIVDIICDDIPHGYSIMLNIARTRIYYPIVNDIRLCIIGSPLIRDIISRLAYSYNGRCKQVEIREYRLHHSFPTSSGENKDHRRFDKVLSLLLSQLDL
jgi:hypothetical protein